MTDNLEKGYSLCWNEWALDFSIKGELGLLLIISSLTAKEGYCFASNSYFAEKFGISETSVSKKIKKLEEKGYISIFYKKRGCEVVLREIRITTPSPVELSKVKPSNEDKLSRTDEDKLKDNITSINNINSNNNYNDSLESLFNDIKINEDELTKSFDAALSSKTIEPKKTKKKSTSSKKKTNLKDDDFYKPIYDKYREVYYANFSGIPNCGKYKDFTDRCIERYRAMDLSDEQIQSYIINAIQNSAADKFLMDKRLPFAAIVSDAVMPRLVSETNRVEQPKFGVDFNNQNYGEVF